MGYLGVPVPRGFDQGVLRNDTTSQGLTKLLVIPIKHLFICVHCQFRIQVLTQINGLLLILCYQRHDFQLKNAL